MIRLETAANSIKEIERILLEMLELLFSSVQFFKKISDNCISLISLGISSWNI